MIDAKGAAAPGGPRRDAELFAEVARRAAAREPFALCTVVSTHRSAPRDAGAKMLVAPDGSICGTVGGGPLEASVLFEAVQLLRGGGQSGIRRFALTTAGDAAEPLPAAPSPGEDLGMKCGGEASVFIDVVRPAARLVIYGAGHVGERLANLAAEAGLTAVVVDDRPDFARRERFPRAAEVRCADLEKDPLGGLSPGPEDFLVVLTRCHALDEAVLEAALRAPARYVGLIGSRRKVALILRSIARRLGRDPRADARLHAPIGLKLGDKSPGEIAISILAEILLVKSSGELAHNRLAPTHKGQRDHRREADTVQQAGGDPETGT
ncbi:MAG TPA: XdhC/CoxI family protein [Myxococcales bacterium]|nr:XdhC/CoxI family protein [Myxococcales bacterium]